MESYLLKIYQTYFIHTTNVEQYLEVIDLEIKNTFTQKEISFFVKCNDENRDLLALEYLLRKKRKKNIFSFVFLRLSSLAESLPENQNKYVNKSKATLLKIFIVLAMAVINTILLEFQRFTLSDKIKEYLDV